MFLLYNQSSCRRSIITYILDDNLTHFITKQKQNLVLKALFFTLVQGQLYHMGHDQILRICLQPKDTQIMILMHKGLKGGHFFWQTSHIKKNYIQNIGGLLITKIFIVDIKVVITAKHYKSCYI